MPAIHFIALERKTSLQRTENESGSKAEYSALEHAENLRNQKKSCEAIEKKKPGRQGGGSKRTGPRRRKS